MGVPTASGRSTPTGSADAFSKALIPEVTPPAGTATGTAEFAPGAWL